MATPTVEQGTVDYAEAKEGLRQLLTYFRGLQVLHDVFDKADQAQALIMELEGRIATLNADVAERREELEKLGANVDLAVATAVAKSRMETVNADLTKAVTLAGERTRAAQEEADRTARDGAAQKSALQTELATLAAHVGQVRATHQSDLDAMRQEQDATAAALTTLKTELAAMVRRVTGG